MLRGELEVFVSKARQTAKRPCFNFINEDLTSYFSWAFSRDYLSLVSDESGITGISIAYPLPKKYDGNLVSLLPFDEILTNEDDKDLCILDWYATKVDARISLVDKFMKRYPNWENQDKWGRQYGVTKQLSNKYIKLLTLKY
jgi:hypothetical protein